MIWSRDAIAALIEIHTYVAADRPIAADGLRDRLVIAGESLAAHPLRGRLVGKRVRQIVVWPYLIRYVVTAAAVRILTIRHGARRPLR